MLIIARCELLGLHTAVLHTAVHHRLAYCAPSACILLCYTIGLHTAVLCTTGHYLVQRSDTSPGISLLSDALLHLESVRQLRGPPLRERSDRTHHGCSFLTNRTGTVQ